MAFRWRANDSLWFFRGPVPALPRNPIILWFFSRGSGPPAPLLWIRAFTLKGAPDIEFESVLGKGSLISYKSYNSLLSRERSDFAVVQIFRKWDTGNSKSSEELRLATCTVNFRLCSQNSPNWSMQRNCLWNIRVLNRWSERLFSVQRVVNWSSKFYLFVCLPACLSVRRAVSSNGKI